MNSKRFSLLAIGMMVSLIFMLMTSARCQRMRIPNPFSPEGRVEIKDNIRFANLWKQRSKRDVSRALVPFLRSSDPSLCERAICALGRLENPQMLSVLISVKGETRVMPELLGMSPLMSDPTRRLAIVRIRTRNLHGQARVVGLLRGVGWTLAEGQMWSKRIEAPRAYLKDSDQARVIREVVDLLYNMGKKGENIAALRRGFAFATAQNIQLDCAKLNKAQEVERILDYGMSLDVTRWDDEYLCVDHLVSLGAEAEVGLKKRLQREISSKKTYANHNPFNTMMRAAAKTNNMRFLPLLTKLAKVNPQHDTVFYADQASSMLRERTAYPRAPQ